MTDTDTKLMNWEEANQALIFGHCVRNVDWGEGSLTIATGFRPSGEEFEIILKSISPTKFHFFDGPTDLVERKWVITKEKIKTPDTVSREIIVEDEIYDGY